MPEKYLNDEGRVVSRSVEETPLECQITWAVWNLSQEYVGLITNRELTPLEMSMHGLSQMSLEGQLNPSP